MNQKPIMRSGSHNVTQLVYHMTLSLKYRAALFNETLSSFIKSAIRKICGNIGIVIININTSRDHIHILFQNPPKLSTSYIANRIKGGSSWLARLNFPCLKIWCPEHFWSGGYFCETVGTNWKIHYNYIKNQEA